MKFCLEGVYSDVVKGLGHVTFHAKFHTGGVNYEARTTRSDIIKNMTLYGGCWLCAPRGCSNKWHSLQIVHTVGPGGSSNVI